MLLASKNALTIQEAEPCMRRTEKGQRNNCPIQAKGNKSLGEKIKKVKRSKTCYMNQGHEKRE
jgi:hypothetical protein